MDEMKEGGEQPAAEPVAESVDGRRLAVPRLSKRVLILAAAGFLVLVLIVSGVLIYRGSVERKKAAEVAAQAKREQAARAAAEQAEMEKVAEEARRSHREIMEASPPAAEVVLPSPRQISEKVAAPAAAMAPPKVESPKSEAAKPAATPMAVAEATPAPPVAASPRASGGCTLTGKTAGSYGQALGRCLEDYNRVEGRSREGAAAQRR